MDDKEKPQVWLNFEFMRDLGKMDTAERRVNSR